MCVGEWVCGCVDVTYVYACVRLRECVRACVRVCVRECVCVKYNIHMTSILIKHRCLYNGVMLPD